MGLREDITALVKLPGNPDLLRRLSALEAAGALAETTAVLVPAAPQAAASSGNGVASPLTIDSIDYYPEQTLSSSDGLITMQVLPWDRWRCTDANDTPLVIVFPGP